MNKNGFCEKSSYNTSYRSSYSGPVKGGVELQKTFPQGLASHPIIDNKGRLICATNSGLVLMDPKENRESFLELKTIKSLALSKNGIIISTGSFIYLLDDTDTFVPIEISEKDMEYIGSGFLHMAIIDDMLCGVSEQSIVCLKLTNITAHVIWQDNLTDKFGFSGNWQLTISEDKNIFVSGAMAWPGDEGQEYASYIVAFSPEGEMIWQKTRNLDNLPTAAGNKLRMSAYRNLMWFSEDGIVVYDFSGKELWREWNTDGPVSFMAINSKDTAFFMRADEIYSISSGDLKEFDSNLVSSIEGSFIDCAIDSDDNIYVLTTEGLFKIDPCAKILFCLSGLIGERICIGNSFLAVSSMVGKITIVF